MKNYLIIILSLIILFLGFKMCTKSNEVNDSFLFQTEITKLEDSLKIYKLQNGNILTEISVIRGTLQEKNSLINQLKDKNFSLKGEIALLTNLVVNFKIDSSNFKKDTIFTNKYVYQNIIDSFKIDSFKEQWKFNYLDSSLNFKINGHLINKIQNSKLISSEINTDSAFININGTLIITKVSNTELKSYLLFKSSNSIVNMNLESKAYLIETKKNKRFSFGPQIGVMINSSSTSNIGLQVKPYIGIGFQYSLFSF